MPIFTPYIVCVFVRSNLELSIVAVTKEAAINLFLDYTPEVEKYRLQRVEDTNGNILEDYGQQGEN